jgi:hypothetical protein
LPRRGAMTATTTPLTVVQLLARSRAGITALITSRTPVSALPALPIALLAAIAQPAPTAAWDTLIIALRLPALLTARQSFNASPAPTTERLNV